VELQKTLKAGLNPNAMIYIPDTNQAMGLLELAVRAKNEPIAMALLDAGAAIDGYSEKLGPLISIAVQQGLEHVTRFVIENKPDELLRLNPDNFPLAYAVDQGNLALVKLLLRELVKDKEKYQELLDKNLIISIYKGPQHASISHTLIDAGADIEANKTLVLVAAIYGNSLEFVDEAFKVGANPNSEYQGMLVLQIAIELASSDQKAGSVLIIWKILEVGANQCFLDTESNDLPENVKYILLRFRSC